MSDSAVADSSVFEIKFPRPLRIALGMSILVAIVVATVALSVRNLRHPHQAPWVGLIGSIAWLLLVAFIIAGFSYGMGGVRPLLIRMLGAFSATQLVRIERADVGKPVVCIGFRLLGQELHYRVIDLAGITKVNWGPGQGSHRAGRDIADWSVAMWYDAAAVRSTPPRWDRRDREQLDIVGFSDTKEATAQLGASLADFLRAAGARLEREPGGSKFVRATA